MKEPVLQTVKTDGFLITLAPQDPQVSTCGPIAIDIGDSRVTHVEVEFTVPGNGKVSSICILDACWGVSSWTFSIVSNFQGWTWPEQHNSTLIPQAAAAISQIDNYCA